MPTNLRRSGISVVGDTPWGTHSCYFYETKTDLLAILVPYFAAGLENGERCIWVVYDPLDEAGAAGALREVVPSLDDRITAGDLDIVPHSRWYLRDGVFDVRRAMDEWRRSVTGALANGYAGLRVNGSAAWVTERD